MKPIYFPFTYTSDPVAEALAACFGQFIVYRPLTDKVPGQMQTWINKNILTVRIPVVEDEKELETAAKNYLNWAQVHKGGCGIKTAFSKTLKESLPFSGHSLSSQIVTNIKEQMVGSSSAEALDHVMAARIFLYFAQEFDRQSQAVNDDLKWYRQKEADLMRQLKMDENCLAAESWQEQVQMPDASADYMISDRLEAWTRIMLMDSDGSGLFVTHSPAVLDHLLDRSPTAEKFLHFESIPLGEEMITGRDPWQQKLVSNLARIVENKWPALTDEPPDTPAFPVTGNTVSLSVYLVPNQMPADFFSRCAEIKRHESGKACHSGRFKNTLIGLIERHSSATKTPSHKEKILYTAS